MEVIPMMVFVAISFLDLWGCAREMRCDALKAVKWWHRNECGSGFIIGTNICIYSNIRICICKLKIAIYKERQDEDAWIEIPCLRKGGESWAWGVRQDRGPLFIIGSGVGRWDTIWLRLEVGNNSASRWSNLTVVSINWDHPPSNCECSAARRRRF